MVQGFCDTHDCPDLFYRSTFIAYNNITGLCLLKVFIYAPFVAPFISGCVGLAIPLVVFTDAPHFWIGIQPPVTRTFFWFRDFGWWFVICRFFNFFFYVRKIMFIKQTCQSLIEPSVFA